MPAAALPDNEAERLAKLRAYGILDTPPETAFDDIVWLAARAFETPIALVSLIDEERQWFKSKLGLSACETPRGVAFCSHALLEPDRVLVVPDSRKDSRFASNPLVGDSPNVVFYAGAPLLAPGGLPMGTLCVIDNHPRQPTDEQVETLRALARQVVSQLELRSTCGELNTLAGSLTRANKELEEFAYIAAHDLQEPVRKLVSFSKLLEDDLGDDLPSRAAEDLSHIVGAATRMRQLIADLLRLSRTGTAEIGCERVLLDDCVRTALEAVSLRVQETGAEIEVDPLPAVTGNVTLLTQLFQNLIGNALKFVDARKPRIRITCERGDGEVVFGVEDNGIGIDPKYAEKIFAPFRRLYGRKHYEGTGIGLAISRKAVDRHGGRIWVESEPGRGSHFRFTLQAVEEPALVS